MNNKEAVEILKKYHDSALLEIHLDFLSNPTKYQNDGMPNEFIQGTESVRLAIDEAIAALEQQEKEPCNQCDDEGTFWKAQLSGEIAPRQYKYCHYCGRKLEE